MPVIRPRSFIQAVNQREPPLLYEIVCVHAAMLSCWKGQTFPERATQTGALAPRLR
jgi:hypothetical protein